MNTGNMRHTVKIYKKEHSRNEVGEVVSVLNLYITIKAEIQFEKVQDSGSKFDDSWNNRLVVISRYGNQMMSIINNRSDYVFEFQGANYQLKSFEQWNRLQKFIKFYVQKDK